MWTAPATSWTVLHTSPLSSNPTTHTARKPVCLSQLGLYRNSSRSSWHVLATHRTSHKPDQVQCHAPWIIKAECGLTLLDSRPRIWVSSLAPAISQSHFVYHLTLAATAATNRVICCILTTTTRILAKVLKFVPIVSHSVANVRQLAVKLSAQCLLAHYSNFAEFFQARYWFAWASHSNANMCLFTSHTGLFSCLIAVIVLTIAAESFIVLTEVIRCRLVLAADRLVFAKAVTSNLLFVAHTCQRFRQVAVWSLICHELATKSATGLSFTAMRLKKFTLKL